MRVEGPSQQEVSENLLALAYHMAFGSFEELGTDLFEELWEQDLLEEMVHGLVGVLVVDLGAVTRSEHTEEIFTDTVAGFIWQVHGHLNQSSLLVHGDVQEDIPVVPLALGSSVRVLDNLGSEHLQRLPSDVLDSVAGAEDIDDFSALLGGARGEHGIFDEELLHMPPNVGLHRELNGGELDHLREEFISLDDIRHSQEAVLEFQVLLVWAMLADLMS